MSALSRPNRYAKHGKLQESYVVKKQKLDRIRLEKELVNKIHPENEEYSTPHDSIRE
jgi:hypothetical protein